LVDVAQNRVTFAGMSLTRGELLAALGAAPLAAGGCCLRGYPKATHFPPAAAPVVPLPGPALPRLHALAPVIDVHAHFFNASDVPVRGFLAECIAHSAPAPLRALLELASPLADLFAVAAPSAARELRALRDFDRDVQGLAAAEVARRYETLIAADRASAAERVRDTIQGSSLERELLRRKRTSSLSAAGILGIVEAARQPADRAGPRRLPRPLSSEDAADGFLGFLFHMLSMRASNLEAYREAYATHTNAFGIESVLGSLVDFDYWIDCPPVSSHEDQIEVHARLAKARPDFFRPLVAYNPWTDIEQNDAGLKRVEAAIRDRGFAGVKIYPPMGFKPAGNETNPPKTRKPRPELGKLDEKLKAFFDLCASLDAPVVAHTARTNGRDDAHDEFGGPDGWRALVAGYAAGAKVATIDLGHFGGHQESTWTQEFAVLMKDYPTRRLFGDLGFWDALMCSTTPGGACRDARRRLEQALAVTIDDTVTVADRVMFATDWLMLSQIPGWPDYPALVLESLQAIAPPEVVKKIFGLNARDCFKLPVSLPHE
jgi:predicted TIM-barrel fold metal-dependent hydrolase